MQKLEAGLSAGIKILQAAAKGIADGRGRAEGGRWLGPRAARRGGALVLAHYHL